VSARKQIAVVVATTALDRTREALRAAVGLSLRGDAVHVVVTGDPPDDDPDVRRALGTLRQLGHAISREPPDSAIRAADAVEVWT
jgi:hypothetical protein